MVAIAPSADPHGLVGDEDLANPAERERDQPDGGRGDEDGDEHPGPPPLQRHQVVGGQADRARCPRPRRDATSARTRGDCSQPRPGRA